MKSRPFIYPILLVLAPILSLYAHNVYEVAAGEIVFPCLVVSAIVGLVWLVFRAFFKDGDRASLWTTVLIIAFYTVDRAPEIIRAIITWLTEFWVKDVPEGTLYWTCIPSLIVYLIGGVLVERLIKDRRKLTGVLSVFSVVLIVMPIFTLLGSRPHLNGATADEPSPPALAQLPLTTDKPDFYYIILDAFARADLLEENFKYDLEPFLAHLEKRGFYIARQSTSNYSQTRLSLSSSLNGIYHEPRKTAEESNDVINYSYFRKNAVFKSLQGLGYRYVSFGTGVDFTDMQDVDVYLSPYNYASEFQRLLVTNSVLRFMINGPYFGDEYSALRVRANYTLSQLPQVPKLPGPKFVFAHILSPHPPFVFGEHGEDVSPHALRYLQSDGNIYREYYGDANSYIKGYRAQAAYLVTQVEKVIDEILATSPKPPVIILQSDHGSGLRLDVTSAENTDHHERMSILNAYYIPGHHYEGLSQTITPINSFRAVFNNVFGLNLPLVPEENYYSTMKKPFDFVKVTEKVRSRKSETAAIPGSPH